MTGRQVATFWLGGHQFAVEVGRVQEVLRPQPITPVPRAPRGVAGLINLRGQVIAAVDLATRFPAVVGSGVGGAAVDGEDGAGGSAGMTVVVQAGDEAVAMLVDAIGDVVNVEEGCFEVPPPTLDPALADLVLGAFKLPDGLLLLLDVDTAVAV